ncbi:MAG TPA: YbhB/YbcL family Raf kinase inhibitor-like protein [Terriglobia bacterium]
MANGIAPRDVRPLLPADSGFSLTPLSFQANGDISARFTCSGQNLSPALTWSDPPAGTQSFVLITDDPDAPGGVFTHWVIYDLPSSLRHLPEGVPHTRDPEGGRQGSNDFEQTGYSGPCPPPGKYHRYFFRLYALDKRLDLRAGAPKDQVEDAMKGHVLAQADVMGRFKR